MRTPKKSFSYIWATFIKDCSTLSNTQSNLWQISGISTSWEMSVYVDCKVELKSTLDMDCLCIFLWHLHCPKWQHTPTSAKRDTHSDDFPMDSVQLLINALLPSAYPKLTHPSSTDQWRVSLGTLDHLGQYKLYRPRQVDSEQIAHKVYCPSAR